MNLSAEEAADLRILGVKLEELKPLFNENGDKVYYSFDMLDVVELFSKFGKVEEVNILPYPNGHIATVTMSSIVEAFYAAKVLNNQLFHREKCLQLKVSFIGPGVDRNKLKDFKEKKMGNSKTFKKLMEKTAMEKVDNGRDEKETRDYGLPKSCLKFKAFDCCNHVTYTPA